MPDEVIHGIVGGFIGGILARQGRILLDGFPRTMVQLEFLEQFLKDAGSELHGVFFLEIDKERLIERLTGRRICESCGAVFHIQALPARGVCDVCGGKLIQRKDDNRESIQERLNAYEKQTYPILKAFETEGKLIKVNGDQSREVVYGAIAGHLRQLLQKTALAHPV
jgi:adenylate kinase